MLHLVPRNRLREIREASSLSMAELGEKVGKHESTISRWETEKSRIPYGYEERLAEILGCSVAYLMGFDVPESGNGNGNGAETDRGAA